VVAPTLAPNSLYSRERCSSHVGSTESLRAAFTLAPHAFIRAAVPATAAEASRAEVNCAFRATKATEMQLQEHPT
jgi:hypothetical protein